MDIERWRQHVLEPLLEGHEPTADADALGGLALLAADTDRTQDYVFESAKLPEVRGASHLLDTLNVERIPDLFREHGLTGKFVDQKPPGEIVYAGGGGLLALVPLEKAGPLAQAIEAEYPQVTGAATITADWREVTPTMVLNGYSDGGFGELVRWAGHWLSRRKEGKQPPPFYEALPHAARCNSCHARPANQVLFANLPGEERAICPVCERKRQPEEDFERSFWFEKYQEAYEVKEALHPQDLSEIGQASSGRKGYVGFIHLDGDELGSMLFRSETPLAYRDFSRTISQAAKEIVMDVLHEYLPPTPITGSSARREAGQADLVGKPIAIHPFEIITIGGDDIWLIVPGDRAIPIAAAISTAFSERVHVPDESRKPCTMSGGVVIADDHNPVRILQDLAKKLTRQAKRARHEAKAEAEVNVGYIDFHIFKSADMLDREISTLRRKYPYTMSGLGEGGKDLRLMARPYPADVLHELWQELEVLRGHDSPFPTSQMHRLAEALLLGRHQSTLFYEYQRARDDKGHFVRLDAALGVAQCVEVEYPTPWEKPEDDDQYSHQTALWDIAELYEFVSREGKGQ
ncbi:MAG TPA: hypothetical protein VMY40_05410 [Anaerolineae bacterium]|nr:hypothetical protein [Anaerolineae bacterium]